MKTLRIIGMALFAVLMCVNFIACGGDDGPNEESTTDLSKVIIGTWIRDDGFIWVVKSDKTMTGYDDITDYRNNVIDCILQWETKGKEWIYIYEDGDLYMKWLPRELTKDFIIWKVYEGEAYDNYLSDEYGAYFFSTWERYSK